MDDMLDIEAIAALEPISSFAPARMYELLDYCHLEFLSNGQDPFKTPGLDKQLLYLVDGELDLLFQDNNRLKISAGSEWAKHPLGKFQPPITEASALGNVRLMCISNEMLDIMVERNLRLSQGDAGEAESRHTVGNGHQLSSGMGSLKHFKAWPFMQLPPENLGKLMRLVEVVAAWDNDTIIREGDEGDCYYMLEKGCAEVYRLVGGVNMVLARLKPGDAFGEEALISGARRNATVTMRSNGVLLRLKQEDFLESMQEPLLHYLSYQDAMKKVAEGAIWLDVRHPPEYRHDKLQGAISMPLNDIRSAIGVLDKSRQYIAYCLNGRRSPVAAFILERAGYDVCVLDGGLQAIAGPRQTMS